MSEQLRIGVIGCGLGVPLGLLLGKTDVPLRRVVIVLLCVPLLLPSYIFAICWFNLLAANGWRFENS